ncbi:ECF transporter S component [Erysipelothrix urinaevulpis]|uniref:ECF transporter S component n=1 Tax=Erysipelothrix urinaevulpis TaxID=2683717 RepID=UPI00135BE9A8|nr:ECF transporter S component [Erysipelothrix urinaevulpis]
MKNQTNKKLVQISFFGMIIVVMSLTPLGFIQVGPIKATLVHIPVIFASLLLGSKFGGMMGFIFGFMSLIQNTMAPGLLSFAFSPMIPVIGTSSGSWLALIIVFIPRIIVGLIPGYLYHKTKSLSVSVLSGSLLNTILVLSLIGILFTNAYASAMNVNASSLIKIIVGIVFTNGMIEALIALMIIPPLYKRLVKLGQ